MDDQGEKAKLLKKFIQTTNDYSAGADQEFYNLVFLGPV
jgi:hypothetical protein